MRMKRSKDVPASKRDASVANERAVEVSGFSLALSMPPVEIADDGEARVGCATISGRFPGFR